MILWEFQSVDQSILEVRLAICVPEMGISFLVLVCVEESSEEDITCAFEVHDLHILAIEDAYSYFKFLRWSRSDIIRFVFSFWNWVDFEPQFQQSLISCAGFVVYLSILNRLVMKNIPVHCKPSIFKIDGSASYEIISKYVVIIIDINLEWRWTWESTLKIIVFVEFGVGFIELIVTSFVKDLFIAGNVKIRITGRSDVSHA